jgi:chromosome segregation ATPase
MGGGNNGMHRGGGSVRTMMALCLGGLVLVTVLYLAKRVESNRTHRELDLVKIESRDITEGLNNKLMECIEKVDSLTQDSTVIGGELKSCKDTKAGVMDQTQKLKSENEKCNKELKLAIEEQAEAEAGMQGLRSEKETAIAEKQSADNELQDMLQENANIQSQLDECDGEKEHLNSQKDMEGRCNSQLVTAEAKLKTATEREASLFTEVQALTSQKKSLEARVAQLLTQLSRATEAGGQQIEPKLNQGAGMRQDISPQQGGPQDKDILQKGGDQGDQEETGEAGGLEFPPDGIVARRPNQV